MSAAIGEQVLLFLEQHAVKSVVMADGILGCRTRRASTTKGRRARVVLCGPDATASPTRSFTSNKNLCE